MVVGFVATLLSAVRDGGFEAVTTDGLGVTVLVDGVDGERELAERSSAGISTGDDDGGGRRALDVLAFAIVGVEDDDLVVAGGIGGVLDRVGTIVVVGDVRSDGAGAVDIDLRVAIGDGGVVLVVEVDGEVGGLVIEAVSETSTFDEGVAGGGLRVGLEVEGRAVDVSALAGDGNGVVARVGGSPGAVVGTIAVVVEGLGVDGA